ncbi:MAG: MaoC family dehydratase [Bryobacterales bacterium]|nr:MaoC family dehydratase [Bryobacterales bacterium]
MPRRQFAGIDDLKAHAGQEVAVSDWLEIRQERIDLFAEATNDHQWIHVDPGRAAAESPFGTTIAHGYLTLSLLSQFGYATIGIDQQFRMQINYGVNKVRFMNPVKCGSRIRARYLLLDVTDVEGGWQVRFQVTVEMEGVEKPACVAETLTRYYE